MCARKQIKPGAPYALEINLRFGNLGRKLSLLPACALSGKLACCCLTSAESTGVGRYGGTSIRGEALRDARRLPVALRRPC